MKTISINCQADRRDASIRNARPFSEYRNGLGVVLAAH